MFLFFFAQKKPAAENTGAEEGNKTEDKTAASEASSSAQQQGLFPSWNAVIGVSCFHTSPSGLQDSLPPCPFHCF